MNKSALWEAIKSLLRVLLFAAIGWGVSYVTTLPQTQTTLIVLSILKIVDSYVHNNPDISLKGIVPF